MVAGAGTVPLSELLPKYSGLKQVMWVVERTSRHMDWNEVPEGEGGKADITVWHDIIDEKAFSSSDLPTEIPGGSAPDVLFVTEDTTSALDTSEVVSFTQNVCLIKPRFFKALLTTATELGSSYWCSNRCSPTTSPFHNYGSTHASRIAYRHVSPDCNIGCPLLKCLFSPDARKRPQGTIQRRFPGCITHHSHRGYTNDVDLLQRQRKERPHQSYCTGALVEVSFLGSWGYATCLNCK